MILIDTLMTFCAWAVCLYEPLIICHIIATSFATLQIHKIWNKTRLRTTIYLHSRFSPHLDSNPGPHVAGGWHTNVPSHPEKIQKFTEILLLKHLICCNKSRPSKCLSEPGFVCNWPAFERHWIFHFYKTFFLIFSYKWKLPLPLNEPLFICVLTQIKSKMQ